MELTFGDC
jgi:hypothetical protein